MSWLGRRARAPLRQPGRGSTPSSRSRSGAATRSLISVLREVLFLSDVAGSADPPAGRSRTSLSSRQFGRAAAAIGAGWLRQRANLRIFFDFVHGDCCVRTLLLGLVRDRWFERFGGFGVCFGGTTAVTSLNFCLSFLFHFLNKLFIFFCTCISSDPSFEWAMDLKPTSFDSERPNYANPTNMWAMMLYEVYVIGNIGPDPGTGLRRQNFEKPPRIPLLSLFCDYSPALYDLLF